MFTMRAAGVKYFDVIFVQVLYLWVWRCEGAEAQQEWEASLRPVPLVQQLSLSEIRVEESHQICLQPGDDHDLDDVH